MTNVGGYSHAPVSLRGDLRLSIISHFGLLSNFWECSVSPLQAYGPHSPRGAKPLREAGASRSATLWSAEALFPLPYGVRKPCFRYPMERGPPGPQAPQGVKPFRTGGCTGPSGPFARREPRAPLPYGVRKPCFRCPMECGSLASATLWSAGLLTRRRPTAPILPSERRGVRGLAAPSRGRSLALQRPME